MVNDLFCNRRTFLTAISIILLVVLSLAGCAPLGATGQNATATPTVESIARMDITSQATSQADLETPAPALEPTPAHPLAGLVYLSDDRLWLVGRDGQAEAVLDQASYTTPSTDGARLVYAAGEPEDLFLKDLATGEIRQLTNTPTISERFPRFQNGTSRVIYHFVSVDEMGISAGYLGQIDLASGETNVLDSRNISGSPFVLSPDGTKIAYGGAPAMVYTWSGGAQPLDPRAYGFNTYNLRLDSAAWSPDAGSLAWSFTGELSGQGDYQAGIVVFDLANHTHRLLHSYKLYAGGEFSYPLAWSSDGAWLAAELHGETPGRRSSTLWLMHMPDGGEFSIQNASGPHWRPDGQNLFYTQWPDPSQGNFTAFDAQLMWMDIAVRTSEAQPLPPGSQILDWIELP
jgi:Tol biopolymer transport system component